MAKFWSHEWVLREGIRVAESFLAGGTGIVEASERIFLMAGSADLELDETVHPFHDISWDLDDIKEKYEVEPDEEAMQCEIQELAEFHLNQGELTP